MDLIVSTKAPRTLCCDAAQAYALNQGSDVESRLDKALGPVRVLANPHRLRIVAALHELEELCVRDASVICGISIALASHHLKALHEAQLVDRHRDGKLTMYRLTDQGSRLVASLLEAVVA